MHLQVVISRHQSKCSSFSFFLPACRSSFGSLSPGRHPSRPEYPLYTAASLSLCSKFLLRIIFSALLFPSLAAAPGPSCKARSLSNRSGLHHSAYRLSAQSDGRDCCAFSEACRTRARWAARSSEAALMDRSEALSRLNSSHCS